VRRASADYVVDSNGDPTYRNGEIQLFERPVNVRYMIEATSHLPTEIFYYLGVYGARSRRAVFISLPRPVLIRITAPLYGRV
jgi:hypothetical protein